MEFIKFNDECRITRQSASTETDGWDNPIETDEVVYEGPCSYQKGGQTSLSIVTRNDVVYLPSNDVIVKENDKVSGKNHKDREFQGIVKVPRDIEMTLMGEEFTKIELTQATGT